MIVLLFWGLQLWIFNLWAVVLLEMPDYRGAWSDPRIYGLSYFDLSVATGCMLFAFAVFICFDRSRAGPRWLRVLEPIGFALFVAALGYQLLFLSRYPLNDAWYAEQLKQEPWDRDQSHLALITDMSDPLFATVLLESGRELRLALPTDQPQSRVVEVSEYKGRYSARRAYIATYFVEYDDLNLFLARWTSFENPR